MQFVWLWIWNRYYKCYSHDVDIDNFSCHLFHYDTSNIYKDYDDEDDDGEDDDGEDDDEDYDEYYPDRCRAFPDLAKDQKTIWDLSHGDGKEQMSFMVPLSLENLEIERIPFFLLYPEKESYGKNENITVKLTEFSSDDIKIIKSKNTCTYKFLGKSLEAKKLINTTDSQECFNTYQFPDHENLINCGHSTIYFYYNGKQYDYQTCFFIPDNHLDNSFLKYYKLVYVDPLIEILIMSTANSFDTNQNSSSIKSNLKESAKRRLQSRNLQYELIVEDMARN